MNRISYVDRSFYIFYIGRYRNKHSYTYGLTDDLYSIEFRLKKTLPKCQLLTYHPIDTSYTPINQFEYVFKNRKCPAPMIDLDDMHFICFEENKNEDLIIVIDYLFRNPYNDL